VIENSLPLKRCNVVVIIDHSAEIYFDWRNASWRHTTTSPLVCEGRFLPRKSKAPSSFAYSAGAANGFGGGGPASSCRGSPMRTGWNSTAAASVQSKAKAISLPMPDMPG
jgi:hypothetical protein